jgi:hypothetical protein
LLRAAHLRTVDADDELPAVEQAVKGAIGADRGDDGTMDGKMAKRASAAHLFGSEEAHTEKLPQLQLLKENIASVGTVAGVGWELYDHLRWRDR